ncbi:MAG TPA: ATP-binding protein [Hymenobacter sp.]|uniref:AlbA family DNA-binding domain-containing protein n=1 Tax=Hymenobacter sp. TaxID=1898978 RepID=UPI002D7F83B5|nr:ATP-binding protein [Hymenobacter sp.]HET9505505.1 ATP-binding protein [Hymenobacter sp.]
MNQFEILESFKASIDLTQDTLKTSWEENSLLEFKKSLHTKSDEIDKQYLTTISGLANNKGGLMIFGIENNTREIIGIKSTQENLDNKYFSSAIRQGLDGNLDYFFFTGKILSKVVGFLYVSEATSKPVIVKINSSDLVRGEIYFRYSAQTARIEAADLRMIISEEIQKRLTATMDSMYRIAKIGPEKVALLNTENGEVELDTNTNAKLILSPETLKSLNIIREGKLIDAEGAPAYTLKGEIEFELEESEKFIEVPVPTLTKET